MRIQPIDPADLAPPIRAAIEQQAQNWGAPLLNHLLYARRPTIFRATQGMWGAIEASGLIDAQLKALLNRRVALVNGCPF